MHQPPFRNERAAKSARVGAPRRASWAMVAALSFSGAASAVEFGPFSLTGFAKADLTQVSSYCPLERCQVAQFFNRHFIFADQMVQGAPYGSASVNVWQFQPYLGAKFDLPRGFKLSGLLSQRWRDGKEDFKGIWYEKNVAISQEDYGRLAVGAMTTRAWSWADYPFGSDIGLGDPWSSSGAGYGLLTHAARYTSRLFDVAGGDLTVEATYDIGKSGWKRNKPRFGELWLQYRRGDLEFDVMFQEGKNGEPAAFGKGAFTSLFRDAQFDKDLGGSSQGIAMVMARYRVDSKLQLSGGLRANRWSGAYAKFLQSKAVNPGGFDIWNNPFNVDWSQDLGGGVYKGYSARSVDVVLGARYKVTPKLAAYTGMVYLGTASTDNPTERGQSNWATFNTLGLAYDYGQGLVLDASVGMANFGKRGFAPLSMSSHQSYFNLDSRLEKRGNWVGVSATYTF
jgi:hypothetical protein